MENLDLVYQKTSNSQSPTQRTFPCIHDVCLQAVKATKIPAKAGQGPNASVSKLPLDSDSKPSTSKVSNNQSWAVASTNQEKPRSLILHYIPINPLLMENLGEMGGSSRDPFELLQIGTPSTKESYLEKRTDP